jgi:hypothetical protein
MNFTYTPPIRLHVVCRHRCYLPFTMLNFFFIDFILQHVPLQKALLHARDCLYVTCVVCFYVYTTDSLLRNTDLFLLYVCSRLKCRAILCVLQSVKVYSVHKHFVSLLARSELDKGQFPPAFLILFLRVSLCFSRCAH